MQTIEPTGLVAARLELHYAAQIVAACADAWLPERADDGHTAMRWESPIMIGGLSPTEVTIGIRAVDFAVTAWIDDTLETLALAGKTLAEAMAWADSRFGPPRGARMRDYDLPASPLASGGRFVGYEPELAALARWYDFGLDLVKTAVAGTRSTEILIWPHHFDLGAIIYLDPTDDTRQIGVGLSPGDAYYAEPYVYVTPSPLTSKQFPALAGGGFWRMAGLANSDWTGAVLAASTLEAGDGNEFIASALAAARSLL
jgi:hypothetical protein